MRRYRPPPDPDERMSVAEWLDCLRSSFTMLAQKVREQVATIIGAVVSDAVRQAVQTVLDRGPAQPDQDYRRRDRLEHELWGERDEDEEVQRDPYAYRDDPEPVEETKATQPTGRLMTAVAAAWQAATWWKKRRSGESRWSSLAVGTVAGAAAYALGPLATVACSAFSALTLADGLANGSNILAGLFAG